MQSALSRPGDVVARIGGEEFAFLLPGTTLIGARAVAELIRERILELNMPHEASPTATQVTLSFGIASSDPASASTSADLLHASDLALYDAKRRGRNQIALVETPVRDSLKSAPGQSASVSVQRRSNHLLAPPRTAGTGRSCHPGL